MRVLPFYSLYRGMAVEDVWHDNTDCQIGLSIDPIDRLDGTANRKHCAYCLLHNARQPPLVIRRRKSTG